MGFSIGGILPVRHDEPLNRLVDHEVQQFFDIWAAA
jgi:hypothetical protein